jgi:hypothetical protein
MTHLNELGKKLLANSVRWFPDPHLRGFEHAVTHMAFGLGGEVGEVLELIKKEICEERWGAVGS